MLVSVLRPPNADREAVADLRADDTAALTSICEGVVGRLLLPPPVVVAEGAGALPAATLSSEPESEEPESEAGDGSLAAAAAIVAEAGAFASPGFQFDGGGAMS